MVLVLVNFISIIFVNICMIELAVFSHISSGPSMILPIKEIAALCKKANIPILVDGAHVIGMIPLNIKSLGVDYYVSNGHKWLFSPKGTAFLWVAKEKQKYIVPLVISSYGIPSFTVAFEYTGSRDYTGFCSISACLDFRERFGDLEIMKYNHDLAYWAGDYLSKHWKTGMLVTNETMIGAMVNIYLPTEDETKAQSLIKNIFDKYHMYIVVLHIEGKWVTRLSSQIFLEKSDFIALGDYVLKELQ